MDSGMLSEQPATEQKHHYFRIFRRVILALIIITLGLIIYNSPPPNVETTPEATQQAQDKVNDFVSALQQGRGGTLEIDQCELNGWLDTNLAYRDTVDSESANFTDQPLKEDEVSPALERDVINDAAIEKAKSTVRDIQIKLFEDTLLVYVVFDSHGFDLSMELEGRLCVENGYLRLDPVRGKLGLLPLPAGVLQRATAKLFDSPENRDKFRLPPHIRDIRISGGQLIVSSQERTTAW